MHWGLLCDRCIHTLMPISLGSYFYSFKCIMVYSCLVSCYIICHISDLADIEPWSETQLLFGFASELGIYGFCTIILNMWCQNELPF